jgi:hypothetical protein
VSTKRPVHDIRTLARRTAKQFPEFKYRQVVAVLTYAFVEIGKSLEAQAVNGTARPAFKLGRLGSFELRWLRGARLHALGGGMQDILARWKPCFEFTRTWRKRLRVSSRHRRQLLADRSSEAPPGA